MTQGRTDLRTYKAVDLLAKTADSLSQGVDLSLHHYVSSRKVLYHHGKGLDLRVSAKRLLARKERVDLGKRELHLGSTDFDSSQGSPSVGVIVHLEKNAFDIVVGPGIDTLEPHRGPVSKNF